MFVSTTQDKGRRNNIADLKCAVGIVWCRVPPGCGGLTKDLRSRRHVENIGRGGQFVGSLAAKMN